MSEYTPVDSGDSGWGTTYHRHTSMNEIHRDIDPCDRPGTKRQVFVFDPEYLAEREASLERAAAEKAWDRCVGEMPIDLDWKIYYGDNNPYLAEAHRQERTEQ